MFFLCILSVLKRQGRDFMMGGIFRLIVAAMLTLMCVCMWGCGEDFERKWGSIEWSSPRTVGGVIVSFP